MQRTMVCETCNQKFVAYGSRTLPYCPGPCRDAKMKKSPERSARQMEAREALLVAARLYPDSLIAILAKGGDDEYYEPISIPEPTTTEPGSPERIEVLAARYLAGQALSVAGDFRRDRMRE